MKGQTTLSYSGVATYDYYGTTSKVGVIAKNTIVTSSPGTNHIGIIGIGSNGLNYNYGVVGTTQATTLGNPGTPFYYVGVMGDNASNNLNFNLGYTIGGSFRAKNAGASSNIIGVFTQAMGSNNSSFTYGVDASANNTSNLTPNTTIAIRGITNSGQSTITNAYKDVANPGGYFSSNDGQGIYATTTDAFRIVGSVKYSRAITGYSNISNVWENIGVLGIAEGTGNFKMGVYGVADGSAAIGLSSGIWGSDRIDASNTYAGYFDGKVGTTGKMGVGVNSISTNEQMEVNGRVRIRRNAFASGLWFNNSANTTGNSDGAFVGLSNETAGSETVGFYLGGNFKFLVDRSGNTTMNGGLSVGGGQTINKIIKTSISTNAGLIGTNSFSTQTYTITGVAVGDNVVVNVDGLPTNYIIASTRVSANDTVEVKYYNNGAATTGFPPLITMYVTAFK